ncbi:MAG: hypothetical protein RTU30_16275 [Candidatus Thorarchaeota archaeon]
MKIVGYFDGTDSILLTKLVLKGYGTIPIANDWDGAGKIASHLEPGDVDLIVGYLHKIVAPVRESASGVDKYRGLKPYDLLYPAKAYHIPALLIVPAEEHKNAKKILEDAAEFVTLVTPENAEEKILELLKS